MAAMVRPLGVGCDQERPRQEEGGPEMIGLLFLVRVAGEEHEVADSLKLPGLMAEKEMADFVHRIALLPAGAVQRVNDDDGSIRSGKGARRETAGL